MGAEVSRHGESRTGVGCSGMAALVLDGTAFFAFVDMEQRDCVESTEL